MMQNAKNVFSIFLENESKEKKKKHLHHEVV